MENNNKRKLKNDMILVVALLVLAAAGFVLFNAFKQVGDYAVVSVDGTEVARYPLDKELETDIITVGGTNTLVIKEGKASVSSASCPDLICVNHREISNVGETIVCLPNKVVISIEKANDDELDLAV